MHAHVHQHESFVPTRSTVFVDPGVDVHGPDAPKNLCVTSDLDGFTKISERGKNILIYFWKPSEELKAMIQETSFANLPTFTTIVAPDRIETLPEMAPDRLSALAMSELRPVLDAFSKLVPEHVLKVSLGKTVDKPCPLFHVDRLILRLLCTLRGPGTEWLDDSTVNRKQLGRGTNRKVMKPDSLVYEVEPLQVCILKGETHPTGRTRAIVHRSPVVDDKAAGRWFLRVDAKRATHSDTEVGY